MTALALGLLWTAGGIAQTGKLALLIPDIYGPEGLALQNPTHCARFTSSVPVGFYPLECLHGAAAHIAAQSQSPASGFTYTFDRSLGVYTRSAKSLGPILAERAETIGKDRFLLGSAISISCSTASTEWTCAMCPSCFNTSRRPIRSS